MDEVIFAEVTAKVSIDFLTVISATIEQHQNVFYNVELKSGAKCIQESVGGTWVLRGDLDSINRAYNLMSTIYNLSQLDLMSNEVRPGAPGTPSFNHSSEYLEVVRYAANTPVVPSLQDDTDDFRSSDETSVVGGPSSEDVTVTVVNDDVSDRDQLCQHNVSGDEPVCQSMLPSPQPDDRCKNRRKRGLPRKAVVSRLPRKVTLLLSAKELGCEKRCLRPRKPLTIENVEGKDSEDNQKLVKTKTFRRRRDVKKQRHHIEDVIKRINRSKMRSYSNSEFLSRSHHRRENVKTSANALSTRRKAPSVESIARESSADKPLIQYTNFKCPDCGKIFSSLSNLYRHQKVSHSGLRYSCASCGKKFTCRISLQRHERIVHEGLRCNPCQRIFASELQKAEHQCPGLNREKSVECQICGSRFSCNSNLNKHVRLLHADNAADEFGGGHSRQACPFCPRRFESEEELVNHAHSVHSTCSKCGETLAPDSNVSEHLAVCFGNHGSITKLQSKHKLQKTVDQPKSRQPISCLHCDKVFSTSSNLQKHIRVIHDNMRFKCDVCSRAYACKEQLAQHVAKVHQGLTYRCHLCQEEFKNRLRLAKHQKLIHSHLVVESSYQCEKCGKTFLYKNNLQRHRKHDHEGLRYACRTCGQYFKSRQQVEQHDLVMHQGKSHACLRCDKVFSNLYKLREHETSAHTNLRPHQCAVCGEQFARHSALSYHLQKMHDRSVNVAGELVPQPIPNASSSSTRTMPDITLASDLGLKASRIVSHLASDSKADTDARSVGSKCKEHNTQGFLETTVPCSLASTSVSFPAPLTTFSPLVYASSQINPTSSSIAFESQKPISLQQRPIVELDVTQVLREGQVLNMPSSQEVQMGVPDMPTYSSPSDVDNNQNPLLALSDSLSFYDSFSYSPLQSMAHHQGPDLSFFHTSGSSY